MNNVYRLTLLLILLIAVSDCDSQEKRFANKQVYVKRAKYTCLETGTTLNERVAQHRKNLLAQGLGYRAKFRILDTKEGVYVIQSLFSSKELTRQTGSYYKAGEYACVMEEGGYSMRECKVWFNPKYWDKGNTAYKALFGIDYCTLIKEEEIKKFK